MLSKRGEIRRDEHCFDFAMTKHNKNQPDKIFTYVCHSQGGNQKWEMTDERQIRHDSGLCIEMDRNKVKIVMNDCDKNNPLQIWKWQKRKNGDKLHPTLPALK